MPRTEYPSGNRANAASEKRREQSTFRNREGRRAYRSTGGKDIRKRPDIVLRASRGQSDGFVWRLREGPIVRYSKWFCQAIGERNIKRYCEPAAVRATPEVSAQIPARSRNSGGLHSPSHRAIATVMGPETRASLLLRTSYGMCYVNLPLLDSLSSIVLEQYAKDRTRSAMPPHDRQTGRGSRSFAPEIRRNAALSTRPSFSTCSTTCGWVLEPHPVS
ncbi:hypothetical protein KC356_g18 [Hortaea werneckii]|nr:hypothetical protein KC356_g18 [Hortaea werneckii]